MGRQLTLSTRHVAKSLDTLSDRLDASVSKSKPAARRRNAETPDLFPVSKYSPDQARDDRGRFASGGGGGGSGSRGSIASGRISTPLGSAKLPTPDWWPTMGRDIALVAAGTAAVGLPPVVRVASRALNRTVLRGIGPVAARMSQRFGGHIVRHFHNLARAMGFKVPRSALRGVPRSAAARAFSSLPPGAKRVVDRVIDKMPKT